MIHTYFKLPSDNNNKNTCHITKKAQSILGFALFLYTISNNTNIQIWLTVSKPTDEKKKTHFNLDFGLFHCIIIVIINFFEYGKEIQTDRGNH